MEKQLVITSIANDQHTFLNQIAKDSQQNNIPFIVIGDSKSPTSFHIDGCDFWSIDRQLSLDFELVKITPQKHYSRKNIGYLIAIKNGAKEILETDDDNMPRKEFWETRRQNVESYFFENTGWVNVYHYFTKHKIWPRGYPLEELNKVQPDLSAFKKQFVYCPIHQGLADENPDVDAVYRLTYPLPINFEIQNRISLGKNAWSPFNSQNNLWFKEAFPLLYLPSYCSFRMTDIWRSYVAQRISWECGWSILYHESTVWQDRNEHNLMKDFEDEIPGYINNFKICYELNKLILLPGAESITKNMLTCYQKLVDINVIGVEEMKLLNAWISDIEKLG